VSEVEEFEVLDLSMPIESLKTPMFPGYPQPLKAMLTSIETHGYNSNVWVLVEHTSTHVDSPNHFISDGPTIDRMPINTYVGWSTAIDLADLPPNHVVTQDEIRSRIEALPFKVGEGWILLLHTGYSEKVGTDEWFKHPGLGRDACEYIVKLGIKGVGVDAPSPDHEPFPAHKTFLPRGIAIYENLYNLKKVVKKRFIFIALPLKLVGGTASPVRAIALFLNR